MNNLTLDQHCWLAEGDTCHTQSSSFSGSWRLTDLDISAYTRWIWAAHLIHEASIPSSTKIPVKKTVIVGPIWIRACYSNPAAVFVPIWLNEQLNSPVDVFGTADVKVKTILNVLEYVVALI